MKQRTRIRLSNGQTVSIGDVGTFNAYDRSMSRIERVSGKILRLLETTNFGFAVVATETGDRLIKLGKNYEIPLFTCS